MFVVSVSKNRLADDHNGGFNLRLSETARVLIADPPVQIIGTADLDTEHLSAIEPGLRQAHELRRVIADYEHIGAGAFSGLVGEFALVYRNTESSEVVAIRDHLGLQPLYYQVRDGDISFSDSLDGFEGRREYDLDFIAAFIAVDGVCTDRTIWSGISPVPPGSVLVWRNGCVRVNQYWSPRPNGRHSRAHLNEVAEQFCALTRTAVHRHLLPNQATWAHLSGGLDSSSVVSIAETIRESTGTSRRLGGTITMTDSLGGGDDHRFADSVIRRFGTSNERVVDDWPWRTDGAPPPHTDQPTRDYPFYARDRSIQRLVRSRGGSTILTGAGPDLYLPVTAAHVVDLVWKGRIREAATELCRWTIATRSSLWRTTYRYILRPMVDSQVDFVTDTSRLSSATWLTKGFWNRANMAKRLTRRDRQGRRRGSRYEDDVEWAVSRVGASLAAWWNTAPDVVMKHPFLDQRLLAFVLNLPYSVRTDSYHTKPILRVGMKGVLPEDVRLRSTKGSLLNPRICWAFARERAFLSRLLESPVLADLGCVEPRRVLSALDAASQGLRTDSLSIYTALSLETWMSVRSGRCITVNT